LGTHDFPSFAKLAEVIRLSRVFSPCLKVGWRPRNPEFSQEGGPIFRLERGLLVVFAKNLARERVHKVDPPTHQTGHSLIRILVVNYLFGGQSLNTQTRVWAAVDKSGHCANNAIRSFGALTCVNQSAKAMI
jgi:hypothetical protein